MDASQVLREEAESRALSAQQRATRLQAQLEKIEADKHAANADLGRAKGAAKRLLDYAPTIGVEYQCPSCWIDHGKRAPLTSVSSPKPDEYDILRCRTCGAEWIIPLRG